MRIALLSILHELIFYKSEFFKSSNERHSCFPHSIISQFYSHNQKILIVDSTEKIKKRQYIIPVREKLSTHNEYNRKLLFLISTQRSLSEGSHGILQYETHVC